MYKRNYLTRVLVRVDCVSPMAGMDVAIPPGVSNPIRKRFPIADSAVVHSSNVVITQGEVQATSQPVSKLWKFLDRDKQRAAVIGHQEFWVDYNKYESFDQLTQDFSLVMDAVFGEYPETAVRRLGLRYVDTIDIDEPHPLDWRKWIKPKLLGMLKVPGKANLPTLARAFNILEMNSDEMNVRFQYGLLNPDYPSPVKRKQFVMDCDTYFTGLLARTEVDGKLLAFKKRAAKLFESGITEALRAKMNE